MFRRPCALLALVPIQTPGLPPVRKSSTYLWNKQTQPVACLLNTVSPWISSSYLLSPSPDLESYHLLSGPTKKKHTSSSLTGFSSSPVNKDTNFSLVFLWISLLFRTLNPGSNNMITMQNERMFQRDQNLQGSSEVEKIHALWFPTVTLLDPTNLLLKF